MRNFRSGRDAADVHLSAGDERPGDLDWLSLASVQVPAGRPARRVKLSTPMRYWTP